MHYYVSIIDYGVLSVYVINLFNIDKVHGFNVICGIHCKDSNDTFMCGKSNV